GQFYRVGGHSPVQVDVRIIAATHQNLEQLVQQGDFREDLFHRLNVIRVHLPPLSQRREDIPQLARHFLMIAAKEIAVEPKMLTKETATKLSQLPWPGNVRQLENTCRWLTVMASGQEILPLDLPPELLQEPKLNSTPSSDSDDWQGALKLFIDQRLSDGDSDLLTEVQPAFERILL
ncbi:sigma 54-interacting transcriptional regulator, partial [Shewanella frigidimarina]|uniref:sigma 54-interacting transcriptional regulator n=1 Tax=Shewanella frigidimarina TaxID=56812 RepID=UPI003FA0AC9A